MHKDFLCNIDEQTATLQSCIEGYRSLIENVHTAIIVHGGDGVILSANLQAQQTLRLSASQLAGSRLEDGERRLLAEDGSVLPPGLYPARIVLDSRRPLRGYVVGVRRSENEDVSWLLTDAEPEFGEAGEISRVLVSFVDITERKKIEQQHLAHLWFLESLDKINCAIQGAADQEKMMAAVLDAVLSIFDCDRAFLLYPCDPQAATWFTPMERSKPGYPGVLEQGREMPMDDEVAATLRLLLDTNGPVKFGPGTPNALPTSVSQRFGFKSLMSMALHPGVGGPWQFGVHQCSHTRLWTQAEERLLQEIGRRLADALTSLLTVRDLRDSEARYRRIVNTCNEGLWVVDADMRTVFANARMAEMLGFKPEDMPGQPLSDFVFAEDAEDHARRVEARRRGVAERYERRLKRRDGKTLWAYVSVTPMFNELGQFTGAFGMLTNISERKQAQAREERLKALMDHNPSLIFMKDEDGRYVYMNGAYENQFALGDWEGKTDFDFWPKGSAELFRENDAKVLSTMQTQQFVEDSADRNGLRCCWLCYKFPFTDAQGKKYVGGIGIDITERANAMDALRKNEERLRIALDAANFGSFDYCPQTGNLIWDDRMKRIWGFAADDNVDFDTALGRIHPDDREQAARSAAGQLADSETGDYQFELRIMHPDGTIRWHCIKGRVSWGEGPEGERRPIRITGVDCDITRRRRRNEQIELLLREINHRAKNLLTVVQAIAWQTAATQPQDFVTRFTDRIQSLAASQDLLVQSGWRGVDVEALARSQLAHFADLIGNRITLLGPAVRLSASASQSLGMALHELSTNASKYGALSSGDGLVTIAWRMEASGRDGGQRFILTWAESKGPAVEAPRRRGFGHRVLVETPELELDASVALSYAPEGVNWTLICPAAKVLDCGSRDPLMERRRTV